MVGEWIGQKVIVTTKETQRMSSISWTTVEIIITSLRIIKDVFHPVVHLKMVREWIGQKLIVTSQRNTKE